MSELNCHIKKYEEIQAKVRLWLFCGFGKGEKYFSLNGEEIPRQYYTKVCAFDELTKNEKGYILSDYFRMKDKIKRVGELFKETILWDEPI